MDQSKGADLMRYVLLLLLIPLTSSANIEKPKDEVKSSVTLVYCGIPFAELSGQFKYLSGSRLILPQSEAVVNEINAKGMNLQLDIAKALGRECRGA